VEADLASVQSGKQNRITGSCPSGMALTSIDEDGAVTCEPWRGNEGHYSVAAPMFVGLHRRVEPSHGTCEYRPRDGTLIGFISGTEWNDCFAVAQLQLAEGVEITGASCRAYDQSAAGRIWVTLIARHAGTRNSSVSPSDTFLGTAFTSGTGLAISRSSRSIPRPAGPGRGRGS